MIKFHEVLTVVELARQDKTPTERVESIQYDQERPIPQATEHARPRQIRVFRCSRCNLLGHRINQCPSR
jgi:hypothetical protein